MEMVSCVVFLLVVCCILMQQTAAMYYEYDDSPESEVGYRGYGGTGGYNGYNSHQHGYRRDDSNDGYPGYSDNNRYGDNDDDDDDDDDKSPCALTRYKRQLGMPCGCNPAKCTYTDELAIVVDGVCKTGPGPNFRSEVGVEECGETSGCRCFIKGCFPRYCNGGQGTCRTQRSASEVEITVRPPFQGCGDKCKCFGLAKPRDCMDGNQRGICSIDPQGVFKVTTGQQNCEAGDKCYTKGNPSDACNDPDRTPSIWGSPGRATDLSGRHICQDCMNTKSDGTTMSPGAAKVKAAQHSQLRRNQHHITTNTVFATGRPNHVEFTTVTYKGEAACEIVNRVETWECKWQNETPDVKGQFKCEGPKLCTATFASGPSGHYFSETLKCQ